MLNADYVIDLGPRAGRQGGQVVFAGLPDKMPEAETLTAAYLNGTMSIEVPAVRRKGNGKWISLIGATGNNLQNVSASFPL